MHYFLWKCFIYYLLNRHRFDRSICSSMASISRTNNHPFRFVSNNIFNSTFNWYFSLNWIWISLFAFVTQLLVYHKILLKLFTFSQNYVDAIRKINYCIWLQFIVHCILNGIWYFLIFCFVVSFFLFLGLFFFIKYTMWDFSVYWSHSSMFVVDNSPFD